MTETSVYEVKYNGELQDASVTKIALKGTSELGVGESLRGGSMVSIGSIIQVFYPDGGNSMDYYMERHIENVNTFYHGGHTTKVIALFLDKDAALACMKQDNLVSYDPRWRWEIKEVLDAIGENHPAFSICHWDYRAVPDFSNEPART